MNDVITVRFFSVNRNIPDIECDSVHLPVSDNMKGDFSGTYGIRKGHAKAVFSLKPGNVALFSKGKAIFSAEISDGFATIENNLLCITVSSLNE